MHVEEGFTLALLNQLMSLFELGGDHILGLPSFAVIVELIASPYIQLMITCPNHLNVLFSIFVG